MAFGMGTTEEEAAEALKIAEGKTAELLIAESAAQELARVKAAFEQTHSVFLSNEELAAFQAKEREKETGIAADVKERKTSDIAQAAAAVTSTSGAANDDTQTQTLGTLVSVTALAEKGISRDVVPQVAPAAQVEQDDKDKDKAVTSNISFSNAGILGSGNHDNGITANTKQAEVDHKALEAIAVIMSSGTGDDGDLAAKKALAAKIAMGGSDADLQDGIARIESAERFSDIKLKNGQQIVYDGTSVTVQNSDGNTTDKGSPMLGPVAVAAVAADLLVPLVSPTYYSPTYYMDSPAPQQPTQAETRAEQRMDRREEQFMAAMLGMKDVSVASLALPMDTPGMQQAHEQKLSREAAAMAALMLG